MLVGPCVTSFIPPVTLFIRLCKLQVAQTFESVDGILWCDHSNESYWEILSCGTVYYAVEGGSNFWVCGWNPMVWPFKWKLLSSTFLWYCLLCCTRWFQLLSLWMKSYDVTIHTKATEQYFPVVLFIMLSFESVDEILWCDHSNKSYWAVSSRRTIWFSALYKIKFENFAEVWLRSSSGVKRFITELQLNLMDGSLKTLYKSCSKIQFPPIR